MTSSTAVLAMPSGVSPRRLVVAATLATAVAALGLGLRLAAQPASPLAYLPPLLGVASLLVGLLALRRATGLAWPALGLAGLLAATVPVDAMQAVNARLHLPSQWYPPALGVSVSVIGTMVIAALHASRPERRLGDWVVPVALAVTGWFVAACILVVLLVAAGMRADPGLTWADIATLPTVLHVHLTLGLMGLGVAADVRDAARRADARIAEAGTPTGWRERVQATVEELIPGEAERHARDVDLERRRLASDLHAVVLPALRRAIAEAEDGAGAEALADRLRDVDVELQRLLAVRWPIVLESFGLVEALEELAEEVEASGPAVEIEVVESEERPPARVERAAWRIAQLAVDNAARHATAARIRLEVVTTPERCSVLIASDGRPVGDAALSAIRAGHARGRGIADMRRQAASVGARLDLLRGPRGTLEVRFRWAAEGAGTPARPAPAPRRAAVPERRG